MTNCIIQMYIKFHLGNDTLKVTLDLKVPSRKLYMLFHSKRQRIMVERLHTKTLTSLALGLLISCVVSVVYASKTGKKKHDVIVNAGINSENQDFITNGKKIVGPDVVYTDPSMKSNDTAPKAAVSKSCKESCPKTKREVCGMRPKTFKNRCMINCLNKDKKKETKTQIIIVHKGKCVSGREYAIPQKDGVGSNTQIAVPGGDVEAEKEETIFSHKNLADMTSDEREEYQYEADVRNISKLLG